MSQCGETLSKGYLHKDFITHGEARNNLFKKRQQSNNYKNTLYIPMKQMAPNPNQRDVGAIHLL